MARRPTEWRARYLSEAGPGQLTLLSAAELTADYSSATIMHINGSILIRNGHPGGTSLAPNYTWHKLGIILAAAAPALGSAEIEWEQNWLWTYSTSTWYTAGNIPVWNGSTVVQTACRVQSSDMGERIHLNIRTRRKVREHSDGLWLRWAVDHQVDPTGMDPKLSGHVRILMKE